MGEMPLKFPVPPASFRKNALRSGAASSSQNIAAFRACYERYLECLEFCDGQSASPLSEAATDFVLDFDITARRALATNPDRYRLFQSRFLRDASCEYGRIKFKLGSWKFASEIHAIEETVGGLFPLAPYFGVAQACPEQIAA